MSPALLNVALGMASKVVVQIDEPSEKKLNIKVWPYLVLVKYRRDRKGRATHCETKIMREAM